jgi:type IV pilus assembly protein PilP
MTDMITLKHCRGCLMAVLCIMLAACSAPDNSSLYSKLAEIKARPPAKIPSLPIFQAYETYHYEARKESDPFRVFDGAFDATESLVSIGSPLDGRNLEALENFPLDTLRYVGQLFSGGKEWAIVTSPDSIVHRVKTGDHLGKNYGEITQILEDKIMIEEIIPDELGGWIKREAALSLME